MKKTFFWMFLTLLSSVALFTACNKTTEENVDDLVDEALYTVQERGGVGRLGCYELVFPVEFSLPDGTASTANSYDDIKTALRTYFQANGGPGKGNRRDFFRLIDFTYPISVINETGEIITVNSKAELANLRAACGGGSFGNHGHNGHGQHGLSCFTINFPISIAFPDGTTTEVNNRQEMHTAIREWRKNNPNTPGRPNIVFPITVTMSADSTVVTVNSTDELRQLKKDCK